MYAVQVFPIQYVRRAGFSDTYVHVRNSGTHKTQYFTEIKCTSQNSR